MLEVIIFHLACALEMGLSWSVNSHGYFVKYELFLSQPSVIFVRRLQCAGTWLYTHLQAARAVRRVDSRLALGLGSAHGSSRLAPPYMDMYTRARPKRRAQSFGSPQRDARGAHKYC